MFTEEWIFGVDPTTIKILPKQVYEIAVQLCICDEQIETRTCLLDIVIGRNLFSKPFQRREWFTNIKNQYLPLLRTATRYSFSAMVQSFCLFVLVPEVFEYGSK